MREIESAFREALRVQGSALIPLLADLEDIVSRSIREIKERPELLEGARLDQLTKLLRFSAQSLGDLLRLADFIGDRSAEKTGPGSILFELNQLVEADEKLGLCPGCRQLLSTEGVTKNIGESRAIEEGDPLGEGE